MGCHFLAPFAGLLVENHYNQLEATQRAQPRRANAAFTSDSMQQFFEAMLVANLPKELVLPEQLYQCIPNEARLEFNKARNQLARESEKRDDDAKPAATGALPKQYTARANVAAQEGKPTQTVEEVTNEDETNSNIPPADFISMLSQYHEQQQNHQPEQDFFMANIAWDVPSVPSMIIETSHNLTMSLGDNQFLLLSDNGANSCLISRKACHIDYIDPHQKAVIRGCKDKYISHGNLIGSCLLYTSPSPRDS